MMRLAVPQTRAILPDHIRYQMLIAAEARRRSSQLGFN